MRHQGVMRVECFMGGTMKKIILIVATLCGTYSFVQTASRQWQRQAAQLARQKAAQQGRMVSGGRPNMPPRQGFASTPGMGQPTPPKVLTMPAKPFSGASVAVGTAGAGVASSYSLNPWGVDPVDFSKPAQITTLTRDQQDEYFQEPEVYSTLTPEQQQEYFVDEVTGTPYKLTWSEWFRNWLPQSSRRVASEDSLVAPTTLTPEQQEEYFVGEVTGEEVKPSRLQPWPAKDTPTFRITPEDLASKKDGAEQSSVYAQYPSLRLTAADLRKKGRSVADQAMDEGTAEGIRRVAAEPVEDTVVDTSVYGQGAPRLTANMMRKAEPTAAQRAMDEGTAKGIRHVAAPRSSEYRSKPSDWVSCSPSRQCGRKNCGACARN